MFINFSMVLRGSCGQPLPRGANAKCRADLHFSAVFYGTEQGNFIDVFEAAADRYSVSNARNADAEGLSSFAM